ncbi:hypothetical protein PM082_020277 [Marasmius tenuissimus]|nr:hypothetical protein PM082_020277 [Marasmius tenuissimus]
MKLFSHTLALLSLLPFVFSSPLPLTLLGRPYKIAPASLQARRAEQRAPLLSRPDRFERFRRRMERRAEKLLHVFPPLAARTEAKDAPDSSEKGIGSEKGLVAQEWLSHTGPPSPSPVVPQEISPATPSVGANVLPSVNKPVNRVSKHKDAARARLKPSSKDQGGHVKKQRGGDVKQRQ